MQTALPTDPQVREALERVYARPELAPRQPGPLDGLREAIGRALGRLWDLLTGIGGANGESPVLRWVVMGVLIALGLGIIGYFVYNTLLRLGDADPAPRAAPLPEGAVDARVRTAAEWEEQARRAAAAGRYREAAVALYQALLLRLEASGALRYDPAKTPGDYRREARKAPQAAGALGSFLRGFEPVVFGGRALDAAGYDRLRGAAGEAGARG